MVVAGLGSCMHANSVQEGFADHGMLIPVVRDGEYCAHWRHALCIKSTHLSSVSTVLLGALKQHFVACHAL